MKDTTSPVVTSDLGGIDSFSPPAVTESQARRLAAYVAGASTSEIAKVEGVSRQAVSKSLGTYGVRATLIAYGHATEVARDNEEALPVVKALLNEVTKIALGARRAVVLSFSEGDRSWQEIRYVNDHRVRLDAASRLIGLLGDAELKPSPTPDDPKPAPPAPIEEVDVVESHTTHTRARRVRRSP
jgi:hypothetical protein